MTATTKPALKKITIAQYEKEVAGSKYPDLFVLNISKPFGNVCLNVQGETGKLEAIMLEATRLPTNITTEVPYDSILRSSEFRRMIQRGRLTIVSNESVMAYMAANKHARDEYESRYGSKWTDVYGNEAINDVDEDIIEDDSVADDSTIMQNEVDYPQADQILLLEKEDVSRAHAQLNSVGLDLEIGELEYILNNCTSNDLKDLAAEVITDLKAELEA